MRQQFEAGKLGMWLFLATEVLLFGGLFCAYFILRTNRPELFEFGHHALDKLLGAANTVVLLVSSLTMALGVRAAQLGKKDHLRLLLALTFLCGGGFMTIKYFEYSAKIEHGYLLGSRFDYEKVKAHEHMDHAPAEAAGAAHGDSVFAPAHVPAYVPPDKSAFLDAPRGPSGLAPRATEVKSHEAATADAAPAEGAAPDGSHEKNTLPIDGRPRDIHLFCTSST
jgi:cytochrome c oxidase subunit 3